MEKDSSRPQPLPIKHIQKATREAAIYIDKRRRGYVRSLRTPWKKYNQVCMGGIEWNTIHTIAGTSGSGKTAMANQLETSLVTLNTWDQFDVLSFNFEMLARNLVTRKFASALDLTTKDLLSGDFNNKLSDENYARVLEAGKSIAGLNIYYVDSPGTVERIRETILRFHQRDPSRGIVVMLDHTVLVMGKSGEMERLVLFDLMRMANSLKKDLKIAFIFLSQLNREIEQSERISDPYQQFPKKKDIFGGEQIAPTLIHIPDKLSRINV
jgi:replicative DNA helicase